MSAAQNRERTQGDVPPGEISPYAINPAGRLGSLLHQRCYALILRAPDLAGYQ